MKNELNEKQFFIIKKEKYSWATNYRIHDTTTYDLTTAVKKLLALDTLNEDRESNSYHLQEVNFSMVSDEYINKSEEPLVLTDEVKEEQSEMPF